jgi:hypothetical protein
MAASIHFVEAAYNGNVAMHGGINMGVEAAWHRRTGGM